MQVLIVTKGLSSVLCPVLFMYFVLIKKSEIFLIFFPWVPIKFSSYKFSGVSVSGSWFNINLFTTLP